MRKEGSAGTWDWSKSGRSRSLQSPQSPVPQSPLRSLSAHSPLSTSPNVGAELEASPAKSEGAARPPRPRARGHVSKYASPAETTPQRGPPRPSSSLRHSMVRGVSRSPSTPGLASDGLAPFGTEAELPESWMHLTGADDRSETPRDPGPADAGARRSLSLPTLQRKVLDEPAGRYLAECQRSRAVPLATGFAVGQSKDISGEGITDVELKALTAMLESTGVRRVNLEGSTLLNEKALTAFMEVLAGPIASGVLQQLSLKGCLRAGPCAVSRVVRLLSGVGGCQAAGLLHLDLSGVTLGLRNQLPLCQAVRAHGGLHTLRLVDCKLGRGDMPKEFISELLSCESIQTLDLGWNAFPRHILVHLGECLARSKSLKSLGLANASTVTTGEPEISYFLEQIVPSTPLTHMDMSINRIDFRAALIMEDVLDDCPTLSDIDLDVNPLGHLGWRSLLRLQASEKSGLMFFHIRASGRRNLLGRVEDNYIFSPVSCSGSYKMDLASPYHRAFLRMLYRTCERMKIQPADAFKSESGPSFGHPPVDSQGLRQASAAMHVSKFSRHSLRTSSYCVDSWVSRVQRLHYELWD